MNRQRLLVALIVVMLLLAAFAGQQAGRLHSHISLPFRMGAQCKSTGPLLTPRQQGVT